MSRLELLDLGKLRARLAVATQPNELDGSLYLQAIGALFLACDPASVGELGMWESIFYMQAEAESVEADRLLDIIGMISEVVA